MRANNQLSLDTHTQECKAQSLSGGGLVAVVLFIFNDLCKLIEFIERHNVFV